MQAHLIPFAEAYFMQFKMVKCVSLLNRSKIPGASYAINPYIGCANACSYCYANFMQKFLKSRAPWGSVVGVKRNALKVLAAELETKEKKPVLLSSVTDPYQEAEQRFRLTRKILEMLLEKQFPVDILTKNELVLRDLDLLKQFEKASVGVTITSLKEEDAKAFEPNASRHGARIEALKKLNSEGIQAYAFVGPIIPFKTDLEAAFKDLQGLVEEALVDKLNFKGNCFTHKALFPSVPEQYWEEKRKEIWALGKEHSIKTRVLF